MCRKLAIVAVLMAACGGKKEAPVATQGSGSGSGSAAAITCPAGNAVQDGACVPVVTAEQVAAVATQKSRLEDLAVLLDQVSALEQPLALINLLRSTEQWKTFREKLSQLEYVETAAVALDVGVKQIKQFKITLAEASGRLGDLKGELEKVMQGGGSQQLTALRATVSEQLRTTLGPLAAQAAATIAQVILPLTAQLGTVEQTMTDLCGSARLFGGGKEIEEVCKQAKTVLAAAIAFVADLKDKPATLYREVSTALEKELATLVDAQAKSAIAEAQLLVNDALNLPAAGSGSGSAK